MGKKSFTYAEAGVDIERAEQAKAGIKALVEATYTRGVVGRFGHFGGCFSLKFEGLTDPVAVSSCDSVGTKVKLACLMGQHDTIGIDIVNHCINDIAVMGAEPLFFLDYIGIGSLEPGTVQQILRGLANGCRQAGLALVGGETAEMPELYHAGEYDLAGFVVGVVERSKIVDGARIQSGDIVYGFKSDGLHTNGYTLARKVCFEHQGWDVNRRFPELGATIGEALLKPHKLYLPIIRKLRDLPTAKGFAHITGGGLAGNLKRIFPPALTFEIDTQKWQVPALFRLIQEAGAITTPEMFRTFNMGIGLTMVAGAGAASAFESLPPEDRPIAIGRVVPGDTPALVYE